MEERDNGSVQVYMTNDYHCTTTSIKIKTRCIEQCMTCYTVSAKYIEFLLMYFLALKKWNKWGILLIMYLII